VPLKVQRRKGTSSFWLTGSIRGRRIRETTGTDDPALAEERRAAREAELYRAAVHGEKPSPVSFAAAALSYLKAGQYSKETKLRLGRVAGIIGPGRSVEDIDQAVVDRIADALLRPGYAPATKLREVTTPIRAVLTHAARRKWCTLPAFETAPLSNARTEWLTPADASRLLLAAPPHLQPLLTFMLCTGARLSEALSLDWRDVDLTHQRVVLRETKGKIGQKRDRIIDGLVPRAISAMAALPHRDGRVFRPVYRSGKGGQFQPGEAYRSRALGGGGQIKTGWASALTRAQIDKPITPHGCRHTWASWHYAVHRDPMKLRDDGGWRSLDLVERYTHLTPVGMATDIIAWWNAGKILTQEPPDQAQGIELA
jgi:integrase